MNITKQLRAKVLTQTLRRLAELEAYNICEKERDIVQHCTCLGFALYSIQADIHGHSDDDSCEACEEVIKQLLEEFKCKCGKK